MILLKKLPYLSEIITMGLFKKSKEKKGDEKKLKALIVDDEESSRLILKMFLSDNFDCVMASNGKEALDIIQRDLREGNFFDVVCLDIMMPDKDGLETLKEIRETEQADAVPKDQCCKVIMTTTASQVSKTMKAFHYGCGGYLVKPVIKDDLIKEINKLPLRRGTNARWRGR